MFTKTADHNNNIPQNCIGMEKIEEHYTIIGV